MTIEQLEAKLNSLRQKYKKADEIGRQILIRRARCFNRNDKKKEDEALKTAERLFK